MKRAAPARFLLSPRLLLMALAVSAVLDYVEWVEHHPPAMAIVAGLHFVFAWVVLAIAAFALFTARRRRARRRG